MLPGSHRTGFLFPQRKHDHPEEFDFAMESYGFDASAEVPVEVRANHVEYAGKLNWLVSEVVARNVPFTASIKELYRRTAEGGIIQVGGQTIRVSEFGPGCTLSLAPNRMAVNNAGESSPSDDVTVVVG